jgi:hypothetical protein
LVSTLLLASNIDSPILISGRSFPPNDRGSLPKPIDPYTNRMFLTGESLPDNKGKTFPAFDGKEKALLRVANNYQGSTLTGTAGHFLSEVVISSHCLHGCSNF